MMKYIVVIPARYDSSRLPGKPIIELCGIPMIVRTYNQCIKAVPPENVYVATEDQRIEDICRQHNIQVLMTSSKCLTGTDRVAEVACQIDAEVYINVQGDEPLFNPEDLVKLVEAAQKYPDRILNGYCTITQDKLFRSGSIPKVVMRADGRLLYMSRAAIPTSKTLDFVTSWRQVCAYAFPAAAIKVFAEQKDKSPLEEIEDIEILRFLELGFDVQMIEMSVDSIAVDTPEDIPLVERAILERSL